MTLPYASPNPALPQMEKEQQNEVDQHQQAPQDETSEAPPKPARSSQMFTATDEEWAESEREQQPRAEPVNCFNCQANCILLLLLEAVCVRINIHNDLKS